jgi:hypothetical protein
MKLMTLQQYMKMTKPALIRKIIKTLRSMPKKKLAIACYNITKSKLPQLKTIKQKALPKRKTKRKTKKTVGKIYHTKNGQPYKILASGKARFVKR